MKAVWGGAAPSRSRKGKKEKHRQDKDKTDKKDGSGEEEGVTERTGVVMTLGPSEEIREGNGWGGGGEGRGGEGGRVMICKIHGVVRFLMAHESVACGKRATPRDCHQWHAS